MFFFDNSTGGNAAITNTSGALVDFSASTGPAGDNKLTVGSIAGAGLFQLGANELTVGGNNLVHRRQRRHLGLRRLAGQGRHRHADAVGHQHLHRRHQDRRGLAEIGTAAQTGTILGTVIVNNFAGVDFVNANTSGITGILNGGAVQFLNSTSASSAAITNNNNLNFFDTSTAGSATITNNSGASVFFFHNSTGGNAAITNIGGALVDFSLAPALRATTALRRLARGCQLIPVGSQRTDGRLQQYCD